MEAYKQINCNGDICVEVHYGRNKSQIVKDPNTNKCRVEKNSRKKVRFMGIVRNTILSAAMIATVLASVSPAYAANTVPTSNYNNDDYITSMVEMSGYSREECIKMVSNSIENISSLIKEGTLTEADLLGLSEDIYGLEKNGTAYTLSELESISNLLEKADSLVKDMNTKGAESVKVATAVVRATLGIEKASVSIKNNKANGVKSFSDVPSTHWAYSAIMKMTEMGLINGTTTPVNGVGTFAPDKTMTRAEFTAIMVRAMYPNEVANAKHIEGAAWWQTSYDIAVEKGLLTEHEFDNGDMTKDCSRQEMSLLLIRAHEQKGNTVSKLVPTERIADWNTIGTYYRNYVRKAYSLGLLVGVDSKGTFAPKNTLSRCQAATVIYRLLDESTRQPVDFSTPTTNATTYNEGQARSNMPQVGDTVIKSDGTKVVLEEKWGVLGAGQGVDIYSGVIYDGSPRQVGSIWTDDSNLFADYRGEVHSGYQWATLSRKTYPDHNGQNGEICNNWWQYEDGWGWNWIGPVGD